MKALFSGMAVAAVLMTSVCQAKEPPTQVIYRFDDHRYLELKGWDCEGELWYTDTQRGIHSQPYSQFYRIFTKKFIHPSERYIVLTSWGGGAFTVSKDFGKTWQLAQFSPGENEPNGDSSPAYDEVLSLTVINDQGFLLTKHRLYMSSRPFDDPRVLPGGSGIKYQLENGEVDEITSDAPGWKWGMVYFTKGWLEGKVVRRESNYQNLPDKVPEVKDYTGWDHMQCDMDAR